MPRRNSEERHDGLHIETMGPDDEACDEVAEALVTRRRRQQQRQQRQQRQQSSRTWWESTARSSTNQVQKMINRLQLQTNRVRRPVRRRTLAHRQPRVYVRVCLCLRARARLLVYQVQ